MAAAATAADAPKAPVRYPPKLCAFCGADAAAFGGHLGRMQGPFDVPGKRQEAVYVHQECALWSPQITVDVWNRLQSVGREVRRARNLRCSVCDKPGAALGCRVPSCQRCFHLPCAIEHGCWFNFELYLMSCQEHADLFKKEPAGRQGRALAGPLKHLKLSSRHLLSGLPKVFAGHEAAAAAAAVLGNSSAAASKRPRSAPGNKRRNGMSAEELGSHMAAAEEAYVKLVEELGHAEESEDDEAVFARKNVKRLRKAEQLLAPTLLQPLPPARTWVHRHEQPPGQLVRPAEVQHRRQPHARPVQEAKRDQPQELQLQQQQQSGSWQPSCEGFRGVGGLDNAKRQLKELVLLPLTYPQLYSSLGIQAPRGILLHGPPGTGKTALVRALAAECAAMPAQPDARSAGTAKPVALFARKGTDCLGKYAGDAELHLRTLFDMAAAAAPSIIFLDELDGLVPARSVRCGGSDQIFACIVSVLLALMDGLTDRGQVLVIGATNRPDNIDPALRRPGRFDREVLVDLPGPQHRADILRVHTAKWRPPPAPQLLQDVAAQTEGWAGADLQALTAAALMAAVRRATPQLLSNIESEQQQHQRQQHLNAQQQHGQEQQQQQQQQHCKVQLHPPDQLVPAALAAADNAAASTAFPRGGGGDGTLSPFAAGQTSTIGGHQDLTSSRVEHAATQVVRAEGLPAAAAAAVPPASCPPAGAAALSGQLPGSSSASPGLVLPVPQAPAEASTDAAALASSSSAAAAPPAAGVAMASGLFDAPTQGGFLAALQEFVSEKPGAGGFLFSPPWSMEQQQQQRHQLEERQLQTQQQVTPQQLQHVQQSAGDQPPSQQQQAGEDLMQQQNTDYRHLQQPGRTRGEQSPLLPPIEQQPQPQPQPQPQLPQVQRQPPPQQHSQQKRPRAVSPPAAQPRPLTARPLKQPHRSRGSSTSRSPAPAAAVLPAPLQALRVIRCDWSTALAELGPPASQRGAHNLPSLSPAAALPWPLVPLLLPALSTVVDTLQHWLLMGAGDASEWQRARAEAAAAAAAQSVLEVRGAQGRQMAPGLKHSVAPGGTAAGAVGEHGAAVVPAAPEVLLGSWGAVEPSPCRRTTAEHGAGAADSHHGGALYDSSRGPVLSSSPQAAAGLARWPSGLANGLAAHGLHAVVQGRCSSSPHCLLLSGHGAEGQAELAASTLKLLVNRAGAAVYNLSLPVMLLLGEGSVSAGLVAGVQDALGRSSAAQQLVLYLPRIELWALAAAKATKPSGRKAGTQAAAVGAGPAKAAPWVHSTRHTLGGWCSGLRGAFSSGDSSDDDEVLEVHEPHSQRPEAPGLQHQQDMNLDDNNQLGLGLGLFGVQQPAGPSAGHAAACDKERAATGVQQESCAEQPQQQASAGELQLSAAWSVFEQQLAVLNTQRQLLVLATSHLPVEQLPPETQQLFGTRSGQHQVQPQEVPQQMTADQQHVPIGSQPASVAGVVAGGCETLSSSNTSSNTSSMTVQVCGHVSTLSHRGAVAAAKAALKAALSRAVDLAAAVLAADRGYSQACLDGASPPQAAAAETGRSSRQEQPQPLSSSTSPMTLQQPAAVDRLIAAALQQKDRKRQQQDQVSLAPPQPGVADVQQWGAALQQLNEAQKSEAQALLHQVQAVLQHVAITVMQDPGLRATRIHQQGSSTQQRSRRRPAASILPLAGTQQQVLAAAAACALESVCELEGTMPLAAVCIKALRGYYWGLDAFQEDFTAAVGVVRQQQTAASCYSSASAAASILHDAVCTACHEARRRLRLYEHSRQQLLMAAALARLAVVQQQGRHLQPWQQQGVEGLFPQGDAQRQQPQPAQQQLQQQPAAVASQSGLHQKLPRPELAGASASAHSDRADPEQDRADPQQDKAPSRSHSIGLLEDVCAQAAAIVEGAYEPATKGVEACPGQAAFACFQRFWRLSNASVGDIRETTAAL